MYLVPPPGVMLKVPDVQAVGQSLLLECTVTTVRGIMSRIDVIWRSDGLEIKRIIGTTISSSTSSSVVYRDFYNISLLTTAEEGRVYQCEGVIHTTPSLITENNITLNVIGKYVSNMHQHISYIQQHNYRNSSIILKIKADCLVLLYLIFYYE